MTTHEVTVVHQLLSRHQPQMLFLARHSRIVDWRKLLTSAYEIYGILTTSKGSFTAMDHLPSHLTAGEHVLSLVHMCRTTEVLKPDKFMFTKHEIADGLNVTISLEQVGPRLQSWLWFGTITKLLTTVGVSVTPEEFVIYDQSLGLRLNTASIHRYLWYWLAAESRASKEERIRHYPIVNDCLDPVHRVLPMQTNIGDRH
ncbi:uncharacterized protein Z519_03215 [Cladophialophora bantiana CBS 173.52]|uniref:NmrA-like domain-containing protein n=1 Tax=Cladophialophora bantiana (strain ATCC 10958 / CBS 173.52 / CDC B-1940 / NIH 8579) TaxID=1442370 RepID=A0A0D2HRN5_CLAB1|nr:uncharacterized protein Z519_03215 [Cladophialophora bantiana CBS 173.52]KIW96148.1 hypothetical protein Z519_03215 [Cladophialophora bantiana CBS 173.52]